jgi:CRISPR/Cas system-associated endonuclease Cas1
VARLLIGEKLQGQARVTAEVEESAESAGEARSALDSIDRAESIEEVRVVESRGALTYWRAWSSVPIRFARRDEPRVPEHWRTFGQRSSPHVLT